ncbi:MAG: hypothetical protein IKU40_10410 [Clostridia bacterium]|nr:hypothetical protein [Clostridia bacterium]
MKQNNPKKTWKAIVAVVLVMTSLFAMSAVVNAEIVERIFGEEIYVGMTMSSSRSPYMNHYEVTEYWPNGNVKTITYWSVDRVTGIKHGEETFTKDYSQSGEDSMGPYGTPNGFHGCHCPNCVGLYT